MDESKPAEVSSNGMPSKANVAKHAGNDSSSESDSSDEEAPVAKATPVKKLNTPQAPAVKAVVAQKKADSSSSDSESDSSDEVCFLILYG